MLNRFFWFKLLTAFTWMMLVMIGCSTATLIPSAKPTLADNPTAGAIIRETNIAEATQNAKSTSDAEATLDVSATQAASRAMQTQQALLNATATAVTHATREAILSEQTAWPNYLLDSFEDNHLDWPIGLTSDSSLSVESQISAQHYQWRVNVFDGNSYFNLIPSQSPIFADFYAAVTVHFTQGNDDGLAAYGLTFRHEDDDYGFFGITRNGLFRFLEVHSTGIYQLWISNSYAIDTHPDAMNRIGVVGVGSDFVFLINDEVVGQMNADIAPGQIGLGVDTIGSSPLVIVEFSDFQINAPQ